MGNYGIVIMGVGQHHNNKDPKDADILMKDFVKKLKDAGHKIEIAKFIQLNMEEML